MADQDLMNLSSSRLRTDQKEWTNIGSITATKATLSVDSRDWDSIASLNDNQYIYYEIPKDTNALELRFQTDADGDSHEIELYLARGKQNHYSRVVALALTGGTQEADNSRVFVDTIAISSSSEEWFAGSALISGGNNGIARYMLDLYGYGDLVVIAPTLQSGTTLVVEASRV